MNHESVRKQAPDWQIAAQAEAQLKPVEALAEDLGLAPGECIPMGPHLAKVDFQRIMARRGDARPEARYIDVTAMSPTPLGEGKTTTTIGLIQGLARLGVRVSGAIRQPSGGPTFNIKGSAAGGGFAQCVPLSPLSLGLTGDIDAVTNANNLAMTALTARMQHEHNYDDARLARIGIRRLDIDPARVHLRWVIDFCAQALRHIRIGIGGPRDGLEMDAGFTIAVGSEVMAILAVARDLADLRRRMGRIVVAHDRCGNPVTTADLEVDGAMTAWMLRALNPNLLQTLEGQPVLVHAGPFANIAIGQSSIIADQLGCRLVDFHVTESGFGADIGYEKFWNIKCRRSGLRPHAAVIVATIRALKHHGGAPAVAPGAALPDAYRQSNPAQVEAGFENLMAHIAIVQRSGVPAVVCLNAFDTDSDAEIAVLRRLCEQAGARFARSTHWRDGGDGAIELAEAVRDAASSPGKFRFLSDNTLPQGERIRRIVRDVYGGRDTAFSDTAKARLQAIEADPALNQLDTCMAKTQYSLSHDPSRKGRPTGWTLPVRDILVYAGAGFVVPVTGDINLLPGTGSNPAYRRIDVDVGTGAVSGLT